MKRKRSFRRGNSRQKWDSALLLKTNINPTTNSSAAKSASVVSPITNAGNDLGSVQGRRMKPVVLRRCSAEKDEGVSLFIAASPDCCRAKESLTKVITDDTHTQPRTTFLSSETPFFFFLLFHSFSFHIFLPHLPLLSVSLTFFPVNPLFFLPESSLCRQEVWPLLGLGPSMWCLLC